MSILQQWFSAQANPEVVVNENFETLECFAVYGKNPQTTSGLTWGYYGGRYAGFAVTSGTLSLTASETNYVVVDLADGSISVDITDTDWNDTSNFARVYKIVTGTATVTSVEDWRVGGSGIF
jgi:hypothetical protein